MPISWVDLSVPFLAAALAIFFMWRESNARRRILESTVRGTARIRKVHGWVYSAVSGQSMARLSLEVWPALGVPYALRPVEWYIFPNATARITEGLILDIRIDRHDPTIVYPAVDWARRR